ncbi:sodium:solute symporter family transporter [Streptomyces atratus]|uniref:sodium:solute symporter family transporter n=1 Tax=Streptomyces atratus TaxID=1893 RepID=UPI0033ED6273
MNPPAVNNTWAVTGIATAILILLAVVIFAIMRSARGSIRTPDDFLLAGRRTGVRRNALAVLGGFIMYSTVIVMIGHIALNGYDTILLLTAFTIGSVLGVLIYAAPMRNVGGHTLGDHFVLRARQRPARIASAVVTLTTYTLLMVAMLAAIGLVTARMFTTSSTVNLPFVAALGVGAIAVLGGKNIGSQVLDRGITFPELVDELGGKWAVGAVGAIAMVSVAAIFAALLINGVTSFTKDIDAARGRRLEPAAELKAIRRNALAIGLVSLVVGTAMVPLMSHILIPTTIGRGGTMVLAPVIYFLYGRRFNTAGLKWTIYGGLAVTLVLAVFSNGISSDPGNAMFPDLNFKIIDVEPGLISIPIAFLLGYIGSITSSERNDAGFAQIQVRALTGAVIPAHKLTDTGDRESRTPSEAH